MGRVVKPIAIASALVTPTPARFLAISFQEKARMINRGGRLFTRRHQLLKVLSLVCA
ncbi:MULTISPECIES: hypothetical protein [Cyanophyceae]|uniref:hypothetical protein n=1 Tax=Cyanophyceae TaxID=3028117 RepID=UPI0016863C7D|nr:MULTISPECIES: hypothetical protein [Cyanophyceae]MBD1915358.1 hypothetical protein [Phormidium sp. FACHB-77]MBD2028922.1 hypothetical protein [Phormidium sp. FACHB-322]MBD2049370.1 hypothetical protein [Leptolyngbya sp. FACHB-60]